MSSKVGIRVQNVCSHEKKRLHCKGVPHTLKTLKILEKNVCSLITCAVGPFHTFNLLKIHKKPNVCTCAYIYGDVLCTHHTNKENCTLLVV